MSYITSYTVYYSVWYDIYNTISVVTICVMSIQWSYRHRHGVYTPAITIVRNWIPIHNLQLCTCIYIYVVCL